MLIVASFKYKSHRQKEWILHWIFIIIKIQSAKSSLQSLKIHLSFYLFKLCISTLPFLFQINVLPFKRELSEFLNESCPLRSQRDFIKDVIKYKYRKTIKLQVLSVFRLRIDNSFASNHKINVNLRIHQSIAKCTCTCIKLINSISMLHIPYILAPSVYSGLFVLHLSTRCLHLLTLQYFLNFHILCKLLNKINQVMTFSDHMGIRNAS